MLYGGSELSIDCWSLLLTVGRRRAVMIRLSWGYSRFAFVSSHGRHAETG